MLKGGVNFGMLFLILPAYNEEKSIGRVIRGLFEHGYKNIVVVNDGSSDRTAVLAKEAGATVLTHQINRGQGAALQTGHDYALARGASVAVDFDADEQFNVLDIEPAVKMLEVNKLDVILGSRFLDSRTKMPWLKRYIILPVSRVINYYLTGVKLSAQRV
jgi:glycosyltransferase involved in cell wall biosynthesis